MYYTQGQIEIVVYAEDPCSIDNIVYVAKCKNWKSKVPQTIIQHLRRSCTK